MSTGVEISTDENTHVERGEVWVKQMQSKVLSLFLVLAMIVTFIPTGLVQASGEYFQFSTFSTQESDPTQVNQKLVDLVGTFNGVSSSSITYKVEQIVNGQPVSSSTANGVQPIIENGSTFKFLNVELSPGLNRITVSGLNSSGNNVTGVCYVNYSNVPVLYDIQVVNVGKSLQAGVPLLVEGNKVTIMLKAPNASTVTINGRAAFPAGENMFVMTDLDLRPGLNPLAIVASNTTFTYALDRAIVSYQGVPTAFNVGVVGADSRKISLENNPTVGPNVIDPGNAMNNQLAGEIRGQMVFRAEAGVTPPATLNFDVRITDPNGVVQSYPATGTVDPITDPAHVTYSWRTTTNASIFVDGPYRLQINGVYGTQTAQYSLFFTYRNTNSPYLRDLLQLYSVQGTGPVTYSSSTNFNSGTMLFELPIWLEARVGNASANTLVELSTTLNGQSAPVTDGSFVYQRYNAASGNVQFKILNLPAGEQRLTVHVKTCTNVADPTTCSPDSDARSYQINFVPAPSIQLSNIYNSKIFSMNAPDADIITPPAQPNPKHFNTIKGRLVNFNTSSATDLNSVKVKINGTEVQLNQYGTIDANGYFTFSPLNGGVVDRNLQLVAGPNTILLSGVANGVPVSTKLTVYLFSENVPVITNLRPVPYVNATTFLNSDPDQKFKLTGKDAYVTNEKFTDVLFTVENVSKVMVSVDGVQKGIAEWDNDTDPNNVVNCALGGCTLVPRDRTILDVEPQADINIPRFNLRLRRDELPKTGAQSVVVQLTFGSSSVSQTLTLTRELLPFVVLAPKLPNERVINQNFLDVAIQAEGADGILIGKEPMRKTENEIFRHELQNLKVGLNKIKFTVLRGAEKLDGEFEVNYAGTNALGAQFKTTIPTSGAVKVFNGDVALTFPKNTMLRSVNPSAGTDYDEVDLFDRQQVLFGIADRQDGRTIKRFNDGNGNLGEVPVMQIQLNQFRTKAHFGYASPLYWVDAGYFKRATQYDNYETVKAAPPFFMQYNPVTQTSSLNSFFTRTDDQWMEPSQRGTIALKYDRDIRTGVANKLTIMKFDGFNWKNLGGVVDEAKQEVSTSFDGFGYYAVFNETYGYNDISGHPFARDYLELMHTKGFMLPKDNNEFGVYDNITRGEFATMLVKLLDIPLQYDPSNPAFSDVPPISLPGTGMLWDYRYIETAAKLGIIRGTAPRIFSPGGSITREQAAVMIANAMQIKLLETDKALPQLQKAFTDAGTVDYYAIASVQGIQKSGLIAGRPNELIPGQSKVTYRFDPKAFMNRAEASVIAERILKQTKRL